MRTDTVMIPRIITTAPPVQTRRGRRTATALLVLLALTLGVALAVIAGRALAYREPDAAPAVHPGGVVELELPVYPELTGTDAGLITTPSGDR